MKAKTIQQPWAQLICEGICDTHNSVKPTRYRGRVLIHAGNSDKFMNAAPRSYLTEDQVDAIWESKIRFSAKNWNMYGVIIGSVEIADCVINHESIWAEKTYKYELEDERSGKSVQGKPIYNWVLANPVLFPEPIPAKGKLSFWDYPNILAEPEGEGGELLCRCQIPVMEVHRVSEKSDDYKCVYCGGKWCNKI